MMTNLFSIFDPTLSMMKTLNWYIMFFMIMLIYNKKFILSSRVVYFYMKIMKTIFLEMKILLNSTSIVIILMLISIFTMILLMNLMGLLPYIFTTTGHLMITLSLALPLWMSYFMKGWKNNINYMSAHLVPMSTPTMLMPFMVMIESISSLIRPLTLSIRLVANMIAGHLLLTLLSNSMNILNFWMSLSVIISQVLLLILEVAVAAIQAYVFIILSTLYASETFMHYDKI